MENVLAETVPTAVRTMVLFFVVDTSGSMADEGKIGAVNSAIADEVLPYLIELEKTRENAEIRVAALTFSNGAQWVRQCVNGPVLVKDFQWEYLSAGGGTDLAAAYRELNKKLNENAFLGGYKGLFSPVIILMTDGMPNPESDWGNELDILKHNDFFEKALKSALAVGTEEVDRSVLEAFAGKESTYETNTISGLMAAIKLITLRSVKRATERAMGFGGENDNSVQKAAAEVQAIKDEIAAVDQAAIEAGEVVL